MQVAKMFPVRKGSHPGKLLDHSPATSISLSKLADESQLGSLSKLLTPAHNNNVNDCNYETWPSDVPVVPISTNNCTKQYESTLQYKSFMPLKKRFRQDFANEIVKESSAVPVETVNNSQIATTEASSRINLSEETEIPSVAHCPVKIDSTPAQKITEDLQEGRTTKFRACKGERYKMFMNTSRRTRNKTNRELEIQQRINDLSNLDMEDYNKTQIRNKRPKKINKTKRKKRQLSPTKSSSATASLVENFESNNIELEDFLEEDLNNKSTKDDINGVEMKDDDDEVEEIDSNTPFNRNNVLISSNKENGIFDEDVNQTNEGISAGNDLKTVNTDLNAENFDNKSGTVVGSRKRKLRKQNIMRLQPGSTFKDMRVVEDSMVCDLGTLAEVAVSAEQNTTSSPPQSNCSSS